MAIIELLSSNTLSKFDRLLKQSVTIYPGLTYVDVNDVNENERFRSKKFLREDVDYANMSSQMKKIQRGTDTGRRYCLYVFKGDCTVGRAVLTEIFDSPFGYTKNDFYYSKLVYREFSWTNWSRAFTGDVIHIMLSSGIANNLYTFMKADANQKNESFFLNRIDRTQPCVPLVFPGDCESVQKYILVKDEVCIGDDIYLLVEYNGDIYRSMDKVEYIKKTGSTGNEEKIRMMLAQMDEAAEQAKQVIIE